MLALNMNDTQVKLTMLSLAALGAMKTTCVAYKSLSALFKYFIVPQKNLADRYGA